MTDGKSTTDEVILLENLSMRRIKYLLYLTNVLFVIPTTYLIYAGYKIYGWNEVFITFLEIDYISTDSFLMLMVYFIPIYSAIGIWGAFKAKICLLRWFLFTQLIILIVQILICIGLNVYQDDLITLAKEKFFETMNLYKTSGRARGTINSLQQQYQCCGYDGWQDWSVLLGLRYAALWCYENFGTTDESFNRSAKSFKRGCKEIWATSINENVRCLSIVTINFAIVQTVVIVYTYVLLRALVKKQKSKQDEMSQMKANLINTYALVGRSDPVIISPVVFTNDNDDNSQINGIGKSVFGKNEK